MRSDAEQISTHRHHVDFDRLNNNPWNLVRMDAGERYLNCDRAVFRRFPEVLREFRGKSTADNHKVLSVRSLPGDHDVFCLTVPEAGNFALESGVSSTTAASSCNVTPFRARVGRVCNIGDIQYYSPARSHLRQRGHRPGSLL